MACLITKLTDAVNDPNLLRLNEIHLKVNTSAVKLIDFAYQESSIEGRIVGDGYFTDSTGTQNYGKEYTIGAPYKVYLSAGEYDLYLSSKHTFKFITFACRRGEFKIVGHGFKECSILYDIEADALMSDDGLFDLKTEFIKENITGFTSKPNAQPGEETVVGDLTDFKLDQMRRLVVCTQLVTANLADLVPSNSLTYFRIGGINAKVTGDVKLIGQNCKALTSMLVNGYGSGTALYGSLNEMLDAMVAAGRSSGQLVVAFAGALNVTFNGAWVGDSNRTILFGSQYTGGWTVST